MKKETVYYIITALFVGFALYTGKVIIDHGNGYKHEMNHVARTLNFEKRLLQPQEWVFPESSWKALSAKYERIADRAEEEFYYIKQWVFTFIGGCIIYLGLVLSLYARHRLFFRKASLTLGFLSFMLLFVGLFCPMMEIAALNNNLHIPIYVDVPFTSKQWDLSRNFEGRMYYFYQNKSVVDVILLLFKSGNMIVALSLLIFSVVFPVTKLLCTILSVYSDKLRNNTFVYFVVHYLGKWSMADVFVASCFLSFLSFANMNAGVDTEAEMLPGMYFYLAFVILSLLSSACLKIHVRKFSSAQTWTLSH